MKKLNKKKLLIVLILVGILFTGLYLFNSKKEAPFTGQIIMEFPDDFSENEVLHWGHMPLSYKIQNPDACSVDLKDRVDLAFKKINYETGRKVFFKEVDENPDISVFCKDYSYQENIGVTGEVSSFDVKYGDAVYWVSPDNSDLIINARVNFYGKGSVCSTGYPTTEVHEILHALGFEHNYRVNSIMRPEPAESSQSCKFVKIDEEIISTLKEIYS